MRADDRTPPKARPRVDRAALAPNWHQVLVVDAVLGAVVVAAGIVATAVLSIPVGLLVVLTGAAYVVLGMSRWRRWARLRAHAGLYHPARQGPAP